MDCNNLLNLKELAKSKHIDIPSTVNQRELCTVLQSLNDPTQQQLVTRLKNTFFQQKRLEETNILAKQKKLFEPHLLILFYKTQSDTSAKGKNEFSEIVNADESKEKKYVAWIIDSYIKGGIKRIEDLARTREALNKFAQLLKLKLVKGEEADINKYCGIAGCLKKQLKEEEVADQVEKSRQSLEKRGESKAHIDELINEYLKTLKEKKPGLEDLVEKYADVLDSRKEEKDETLEQQKKRNAQITAETEEIYNGVTIRIVRPKSEVSACYYGQGTRWCTASTKGDNRFKDYNETDKLYIIIPKTPTYIGEKYQLHCLEKQYMNEKDEEVTLKFLLQRFPELKDTVLYNLWLLENTEIEKVFSTIVENVTPLDFCGFWGARAAAKTLADYDIDTNSDRAQILVRSLNDPTLTKRVLMYIFEWSLYKSYQAWRRNVFEYVLKNAIFDNNFAIKLADAMISPENKGIKDLPGDIIYNALEILENYRPQLHRSLFYKIVTGDTDNFYDLLEKGVDVNETNDEGQTILAYAVRRGDEDVVKSLIKHGALLEKPDIRGWTPLLHAVDAGRWQNVNILAQSKVNFAAKTTKGSTALHVALNNGTLTSDNVNYLISHGTPIDEPNNDGETPLSSLVLEIVYEKDTNRILSIVNSLIENHANVNSVDKNGNTVLINAATVGNKQIIKRLLDSGAHKDKRNIQGKTAEMVAKEKGYDTDALGLKV